MSGYELSKTGNFFRIMGLVGGMLGGSMIGNYIGTPNVKGAELISQQAAIIQDYSGPSPEEALDKMLETLNAVEIVNPQYKEDINGLEVQVESIRNQIPALDESEVAYAMDSLGSTLETYADDHYRNPAVLRGGLLSLTFGAGSMILGVYLKDC